MTYDQRRHEKRRLLMCIMSYLLVVAMFYAYKWSYEVTGTFLMQSIPEATPNPAFLNGQSFPFLYVLCVFALAYVVSFIDLLFDKKS